MTALSENQNHKIIIFDNDGTLNTQFSCWRYLQKPLGIFEPDAHQLLRDHLAGKMDYEQFAKTNVSLWRGMKISDFENVINKIPLRDGVLECLNYFREHGYRIVCVSSGFDLWEKIFRNRYKFFFDDYLANHIVIDSQGIITGELIVNVTDDTPSLNKGKQLRKMCEKYSIQPEQTIMVGDGTGDIKAFDVAGLSFAINPTHDEVAQAADHILDGESLIPLLDYFSDGVYNSTGIVEK